MILLALIIHFQLIFQFPSKTLTLFGAERNIFWMTYFFNHVLKISRMTPLTKFSQIQVNIKVPECFLGHRNPKKSLRRRRRHFVLKILFVIVLTLVYVTAVRWLWWHLKMLPENLKNFKLDFQTVQKGPEVMNNCKWSSGGAKFV